MRRAIIHVGMPRTGTTSLQRVLTNLRSDLGAAGVLYPDLTPSSARDPHLSHQHLGEALDGRRPPPERTELLTRLGALLAETDAEIVWLSYEGLCLIPPSLGIPHLLASLFKRHGFSMEVLATIKPQAEFSNSTYTWRTQFLREDRTFEAYFQAEGRRPILDYDRLLTPWWVACNGQMTVTPLRDKRADQPLITRIVADLGLAGIVGPLLSAADLTLVENRSPGPVSVEVARRLRQRGAHLRLDAPRREVTRFVERAAASRGLDTVPFRGLGPEARARDAARWRRSNDRLAQTVWGSAWASRVAAEVMTPVNEIARRTSAPSAASSELVSHVDDIMGEACETFRIRLGPKPFFVLRSMVDDVSAGLYRRFRQVRLRAKLDQG